MSTVNKQNPSPNRSVSPIHYVKPSSTFYANKISPSQKPVNYKKADASPQKNSTVQQDEVDLWKSRCNELETSLCQVNTDLELASFKAKKAKELENRVDEILKQNAILIGENDQISKQFSQKRAESDIWKNKYETQMNTIIQLKANYETEIRNLVNQLTQQKKLYEILQQEKFIEAQESKKQLLDDNQTQIESIKRSHCSNISLYEEQIRKLKDIQDDREKEILHLNNKLQESTNYWEGETLRLNDDKEKLKTRMSQMELDHAKEIENLKRRCESLSLEQVNSLKQLHESELDVLESELNKLKNLLEIKNLEIQNLIYQNKFQKKNFENELEGVRAENQALKDKILENNIIKEQEINDLQDKLAQLHTTDIQQLKKHHDNIIASLNQEIADLKQLLKTKDDEINNQLREKSEQRDNNSVQVERLNSEIETLKLKQQVLEEEKQREYEEYSESLKRANHTHQEFQSQQLKQIQFLEGEIEKLKVILVHKNNELDANIAQHRAIKNILEEDIKNLKLQINDITNKWKNSENERQLQVEELRNKCAAIEVAKNEKCRIYEAQIGILENELKRTKENLLIKSEESANHQLHRNSQENENRKLQQEIGILNKLLVDLEKQKAQEIQDLRQKLETFNNYAIETIKNTHANQLESLRSEIEDLKEVICAKDKQISEMVQKYQQLERYFNDPNCPQTKIDDYAKKLSQLGAENATNKNLYDVYIQTNQRQPQYGTGKTLVANNSSTVSPHKKNA